MSASPPARPPGRRCQHTRARPWRLPGRTTVRRLSRRKWLFGSPRFHAVKDLEDELVLVFEVLEDGAYLVLGLRIHLIVVLGRDAILHRLAVLAHHDDGSGIRGLKAECQIE